MISFFSYFAREYFSLALSWIRLNLEAYFYKLQGRFERWCFLISSYLYSPIYKIIGRITLIIIFFHVFSASFGFNIPLLHLYDFLNFVNIEETGFVLLSIVPVRIYENAESQISEVIKENYRKCGIYLWTNLLTGSIYIGSSTPEGGQYYSIKYLERTLKKSKSIICASLLKNGFSNFSLQILEYCAPEKVIEREQYYINLLTPNYNIFPTAGSSYGFKHSQETKNKFRTALRGPRRRVVPPLRSELLA